MTKASTDGQEDLVDSVDENDGSTEDGDVD